MIFLFILIFGILFLFLNIRQISPGNKGSIIAGFIVILLPICFIFREQFWASTGQAFLSVWLCEALLIYILWWIIRGVRRLIKRKPLSQKISIFTARLLLITTILFSALLCIIGYSNNQNYILRKATITCENINLPEPFTALFFTDLHLDPLFNRAKLERMIYEADSLKPDFIFFGGDFADVHDSVLKNEGYDSLIKQLGKASTYGAFAVNGNHEGYMERNGNDANAFFRHAGWTFLDDSTTCVHVACISGRTDFQVAKSRDESRKSLVELNPENLFANAKNVPWIILDHQPKGIELGHSGRLPDLVLSGHTHNGQFFPGTIVIHFVWRLAYGLGKLDSTKWLVSSGVNSWGPPVRMGSETEMWVLRFE